MNKAKTKEIKYQSWKQDHYRTGPAPLIVYKVYHLGEKPLREFANIGKEDPKNKLLKRQIKDIYDHCWDNNCDRISYYQTNDISFPFHVHVYDNDKIGLCIFKLTGYGNLLSRTYDFKDREYLTPEELREISILVAKETEKIHQYAIRDEKIKPGLN